VGAGLVASLAPTGRQRHWFVDSSGRYCRQALEFLREVIQGSAAIRHMHHVDAGHHLEQLADNMASTSTILILPGFAFA